MIPDHDHGRRVSPERERRHGQPAGTRAMADGSANAHAIRRCAGLSGQVVDEKGRGDADSGQNDTKPGQNDRGLPPARGGVTLRFPSVPRCRFRVPPGHVRPKPVQRRGRLSPEPVHCAGIFGLHRFHAFLQDGEPPVESVNVRHPAHAANLYRIGAPGKIPAERSFPQADAGSPEGRTTACHDPPPSPLFLCGPLFPARSKPGRHTRFAENPTKGASS